MAKYDEHIFEKAFQSIDEFEQGKLSKAQAIERLHENGVAEGSANLLLESYKRLRRGAVYKRAFSEDATRVFLSKIHITHGLPALALALQAADLHLGYRSGRNDRLPGLKEVIEKFKSYIDKTAVPLPDEEINDSYPEGRRVLVLVSRIERSPIARNKCIEYYGTECTVCSFSFEKFYGDIGEGFIHVHHLYPVSHLEEECPVDPIKDLRPLCPNCHAMAHRENPPIQIDRLRRMINLHRNSLERPA